MPAAVTRCFIRGLSSSLRQRRVACAIIRWFFGHANTLVHHGKYPTFRPAGSAAVVTAV